MDSKTRNDVHHEWYRIIWPTRVEVGVGAPSAAPASDWKRAREAWLHIVLDVGMHSERFALRFDEEFYWNEWQQLGADDAEVRTTKHRRFLPFIPDAWDVEGSWTPSIGQKLEELAPTVGGPLSPFLFLGLYRSGEMTLLCEHGSELTVLLSEEACNRLVGDVTKVLNIEVARVSVPSAAARHS